MDMSNQKIVECVQAEDLVSGCVVFMKRSAGLKGYGNAQCINEVHDRVLGTLSLYGENQHYKTYDVDRVLSYPFIPVNQ